MADLRSAGNIWMDNHTRARAGAQPAGGRRKSSRPCARPTNSPAHGQGGLAARLGRQLREGEQPLIAGGRWSNGARTPRPQRRVSALNELLVMMGQGHMLVL